MAARKPLQDLYEKVFHHKAFTGRSGTMFGFEGLGSIYWHMVSKLLLAIEELFFATPAADGGADTRDALGEFYYRVRDGIGFNKSPAEYGAFPIDPYSHTPRHAGARQPGMTGQVKEEVITRFAELGVRVTDGTARFDPGLLRRREFLAEPGAFEYLDVEGDWQELSVPAGGLAFTWCQMPIIYRLVEDSDPQIHVLRRDGTIDNVPGLELGGDDSAAVFGRSGDIRQLTITLPPELLSRL